MPNFSQLFGGGGGVKGVQRGLTVIQSGATANYRLKVTIGAVNPAKTSVNILTQYSSGSEGSETKIVAQLISSTIIEIYAMNYSSYGSYAPEVSWEVIEYS